MIKINKLGLTFVSEIIFQEVGKVHRIEIICQSILAQKYVVDYKEPIICSGLYLYIVSQCLPHQQHLSQKENLLLSHNAVFLNFPSHIQQENRL